MREKLELDVAPGTEHSQCCRRHQQKRGRGVRAELRKTHLYDLTLTTQHTKKHFTQISQTKQKLKQNSLTPWGTWNRLQTGQSRLILKTCMSACLCGNSKRFTRGVGLWVFWLFDERLHFTFKVTLECVPTHLLLTISTLLCRHFPQISHPESLSY